jgi:tetratricopeptide (TPR) repeat protein
MATKPRIFISAVSRELETSRQVVANTLLFLGYEPVWQDIIGVEQGEIRAVLRRQIDSCSGLVQLVGRRYGLEPREPDLAFGRVSYTQYEALYAADRGMKVWHFLLGENFRPDHPNDEPANLQALQTEYRLRIERGDKLWHPTADSGELELTLLKFRNDLEALRLRAERDWRRSVQWRRALAAGLALLAAGGWWLKERTEKSEEGVQTLRLQMEDEIHNLRATVESLAAQTGKGPDPSDSATPNQRFERALEHVAQQEKVGKAEVLNRVNGFVAAIRAREQIRKADFYDLGLAAFAERNFSMAAKMANRAAVQARTERVAAEKELTAAAVRAKEAAAKELRAEQLAGNAQMQALHYPEAVRHYSAACGLIDPVNQTESWANARNQLFGARYATGERQGLVDEACQTLERIEKALGPDHHTTLVSVSNLANLYRTMDRFEEAEPLFLRLMEVQEHRLGPDHPDTLSTCNALASMYEKKEDYSAAEPLYLKASRGQERTLGPDHPATLLSMNNLAAMYRKLRKYEDAEALFLKVFQAREKTIGRDHPDTLATAQGLAGLYKSKHDYAAAEALFQRVLEGRKSVLGNSHPYTLNTLRSLADLWASTQKNLPQALDHAETVATGFEKIYGVDHSKTHEAQALAERIRAKIKESKPD